MKDLYYCILGLEKYNELEEYGLSNIRDYRYPDFYAKLMLFDDSHFLGVFQMYKKIHLHSDYQYIDWVTFYADPALLIINRVRVNKMNSMDLFSVLAIF